MHYFTSDPQSLPSWYRYRAGIASAHTRLVGSLLPELIPGACLCTRLTLVVTLQLPALQAYTTHQPSHFPQAIHSPSLGTTQSSDSGKKILLYYSYIGKCYSCSMIHPSTSLSLVKTQNKNIWISIQMQIYPTFIWYQDHLLKDLIFRQ